MIEDFLNFHLRVGEFLPGLLGTGQSFGDALLAVVEHFEQRAVGEFLQRDGDDHERDHLREEQRRRPAELTGNLLDSAFSGRSGGGEHQELVHKQKRLLAKKAGP